MTTDDLNKKMQQMLAEHPWPTGAAQPMGGHSQFFPSPYMPSKSGTEILCDQIDDLRAEMRQRDRYLAFILKAIPDAMTLQEFKNYEAVAKRFSTPEEPNR